MPPLAREKSRAGAKAFVRHYIDVINYSWRTLTTRNLRTLATAECAGCRAAAQGIDRVADAGGQKTGAAWSVRSIAAVPGSGKDPVLQAIVDIRAGEYRPSADANPRPIDPSREVFDFHLAYSGGQWLVTTWVAA
jgi:hypothetical protein